MPGKRIAGAEVQLGWAVGLTLCSARHRTEAFEDDLAHSGSKKAPLTPTGMRQTQCLL